AHPERHRLAPPLDYLGELLISHSPLPIRIGEVGLVKHQAMPIGCVAFYAVICKYLCSLYLSGLLSLSLNATTESPTKNNSANSTNGRLDRSLRDTTPGDKF